MEVVIHPCFLALLDFIFVELNILDLMTILNHTAQQAHALIISPWHRGDSAE